MSRPAASLRWRVLLALAVAAVVPAVIVGALAIVRARADLEREASRGALAHIHALGAALDGTLQGARRTVALAASTWADAPDDPGATQLLLRRLRRDVPIVATLSILDADGELRYGDPVARGVVGGAHGSGGYLGEVHPAPDGRRVVHLVVQARGRTGERMGVLIASLDLGFVRDLVAAAHLGPGARVVVVDGAGVPVASSEPGPPGPPPEGARAGRDPAVDRALASTSEGTLAAGGWVSAYRSLTSYETPRGVHWAILHQQPEREAFALARRTTRDTALAGAAALALALALGAFFATRLTRPLAVLARRADAIAAGSAEAGPREGEPGRRRGSEREAIAGPGELGVLGQRLEAMARRIAERAERQARLARGDRLASVGVLSAQVAHEINRPLTTVLGHAKLLVEGKPEGHPDRAALETIAAETARMQAIVGGLLEHTRAPRPPEQRPGASAPGVPAPVCEVAAAVRHVGALLGPVIEEARLSLALDIAATAPLAIETHALQQVLVHLVQNALHAMTAAGATGAITIAARPGPGGVATVITVSDEGPGIPPADRPRVFDPSFTTKAAGAGAGFGLAVCKHLIATAGGTIEAGERAGGRGAELRVTIPNAA
ncbi:MAG TPA: sensor histidine kinase [Kofleriaceae bacterium]|nr:sensor histidine kinase [Kofleriaceae bacterium]